jgi:hypothetical protein
VHNQEQFDPFRRQQSVCRIDAFEKHPFDGFFFPAAAIYPTQICTQVSHKICPAAYLEDKLSLFH